MRMLLTPLVAVLGMALASTPASTAVSTAASSAAARAAPAPEVILSVTVRDADFAQVKVLDASERETFARMWASRREVDLPQAGGGTHYKLDVGQPGRSVRYLYDTSGRVTRLAMTVQPVYRLADPAAFNRLICAADAPDHRGAGAAPPRGL